MIAQDGAKPGPPIRASFARIGVGSGVLGKVRENAEPLGGDTVRFPTFAAASFSRASRGMSRGSLGESEERQKEKSDNQPGFAGAGGVAAIAIWLCEHRRRYFSTRAIYERAAQRVLIGRIGLERCVAMRRGVNWEND